MNLKKILAKDIMSEIVVAIHEDAIIKDVAHLMLRDRINGVPVLDNQKKIVGILTLTDLFKLLGKVMIDEQSDFLKEILQCKDIRVSEIMSKDVFCVSPKTRLDELIAISMERKIHTFPVMENDTLLGIVGRHDVLNAVFSFS